MDISIWAIIIAGISVLGSIAALVYTIYRNNRLDRRTREFNNRMELRDQQRLILEQRRQEIEEQKFNQEQQRQHLEQQRQREEQLRNRPFLRLMWGKWFNLRNGWFKRGELSVENIGETPIVSMNMSFSHGEYNASILRPIDALRVGESRRVTITFNRPSSFDPFGSFAPRLLCVVKLANSLGQRFESIYEWFPSDNPNFELVESRTLED